MKDASDKIFEKMKKNEKFQKELGQTCTFTPEINPVSRQNNNLLSENSIYNKEKDFATRQYLMADIIKEKMEKKVAEFIKNENISFAPKINKISKYLIEADPERNDENFEQKFERLSKKVKN